MPPANRHQPTRTACSDSDYSFMEFMREFPDDAACLEHLWRTRWSEDGEHADCPKCEQTRVFKRYPTKQGRQSWTCTGCGHHVHPTAGTIFHGSSTSLHLWYYAMYLMSSTRCGISAKQLERELGVAYRTAWRMLNLIRTELMKQDGGPLEGDVEVDETAGGGKVRASDTRRGPQFVRAKVSRRPTIWAAVERGGRVRAQVVKSRGTVDVEGPIFEHVLPSSMIFTDEWKGYTHRLGSRYIAPPPHPPRGPHLRERQRPHTDRRGLLRQHEERYNERSNTTRSMFGSLLDRAAA